MSGKSDGVTDGSACPRRSLGRLYLRRGNEDGEWEPSAEARGEVSVPGDAVLRLKVVGEGPADLSPLSGLGPSDIQVLDLSSVDLADEQLRHVAHLKGLTGLAVWETEVGDPALQYIGGLVSLRWLDIGDTKVSDDGLTHLTALSLLNELSLLNTRVGNGGLSHLLRLPDLRRLDLMGTAVDDAGVETLRRLPAIQSLRIYDTRVSEAGFRELQASLPGCEVRYSNSHYA